MGVDQSSHAFASCSRGPLHRTPTHDHTLFYHALLNRRTVVVFLLNSLASATCYHLMTMSTSHDSSDLEAQTVETGGLYQI